MVLILIIEKFMFAKILPSMSTKNTVRLIPL
nr:MAG TPA: hypothetical protein [Caudoviricetes sp.]